MRKTGRPPHSLEDSRLGPTSAATRWHVTITIQQTSRLPYGTSGFAQGFFTVILPDIGTYAPAVFNRVPPLTKVSKAKSRGNTRSKAGIR